MASTLDALLPTVGLWLMVQHGALATRFMDTPQTMFPLDRLLQVLYRSPGELLYFPLTWMILWSFICLLPLVTVRTTLGKWITRVQVRQRDGRPAGGGRMILRIATSWLVPLTLGLAYLWMLPSPTRQTWHDSLSGTYLVTLPRARPNRRAGARVRRPVRPTTE